MADIISHDDGRGDFDLDRLARAEPVRRIVGRNSTKADILFFEIDADRIAVKTYAPRSPLVRNTLGRLLIRREAAAYAAAEGIGAVPQFFGRIGAHAIASRWVDARPLRERTGEILDETVFDRLGAVLDALHERGVALGDLHHRDVLIGEDGDLYVVDLATAWVLGRRPGPIRRALFRRFCESDRVNLARMRARFTGRDVEAAVASVGPAAAAWHRRGRRLKRLLDTLRGRR